MANRDRGRFRNCLAIAIAVAVFALGHAAEALAQDVSVQELFAAQAESFRRLHSLDMTVTWRYVPVPGREEQTSESYVYRFQLEGEKFRTEMGLQWPQPPVGKIVDIRMFDGKYRRSFDKSLLDLNVRGRPTDESHKYSVNVLVLRPFIFALGVAEATFEAMRDDAMWQALAERARMAGSATIDGHACIQVDIETGRQEDGYAALQRVYFARDLNWYPLRIDSYRADGSMLTRMTVTEPLKVSTAQGTIVVPLATTSSGYDAEGTIRSTCEHGIDRASLSVNADIPDEIFQVPVVYATEYSEGRDRSNSFTLDTLTMNRPTLACVALGNALRDETDLWFQPASIYFGMVDRGDLPQSRTIEIMPMRTYFQRRLDDAFRGDRDWLTEELQKARVVPEEELNRIEVESTSPSLSLRAERSPGIVSVHVTLDRKVPLGLLRASLLVHLNDPAHHTIRIPVVAEVRGPYRATPPGLFFGDPAFGEEVTRSCRIGPLRPNDRLEIIAPEMTSDAGLAVAVERTPDAAVLDVHYRHAPPSGEVADAVMLRLCAEGASETQMMQIPLLSQWDDRAATSHVTVGDPAPDFSYHTLAGARGKFSDLKGKVVLVNLFATWCGPCRAELPHLEKEILARFESDKFALICVGIGHGIDELETFRAEQNLTLPMAEDPDKKIYNAFVESTGIPRNYVIDHTGRIIYQASGYAEARFARLLEVLEAAVARVPAGATRND